MPAQNPPEEDAIRAVVARLSRPHRSGGAVRAVGRSRTGGPAL